MFINQKIAFTTLYLCCLCICNASVSPLKGIKVPDRSEQSVALQKKKALDYAKQGEAERAVEYTKLYVKATTDLSIINDHLFDSIKTSASYISFKEKYTPKIDFWNLIYFFVGILGIFAGIFIHFKKKTDPISVLLISLFVIFHSIFLLHINIHLSQLQYTLPHTLFISTTLSFLYGPLIYFYVKRTSFRYKFKWIDLLHLVPSFILLSYIMPYYAMSGIEKFNVLFAGDAFLLPGAYTIITAKIVSLATYGYFTLKVYLKEKKENPETPKNVLVWQRNIIFIFSFYVVSYVVYAGALTKIISFAPIGHIQLIIMMTLIFYVVYIAYVQPDAFSGKIQLNDPKNLFKYKKSGLTPSYSIELKERLLFLLNDEKVYRRNDICLDWIAHKLGTNRHSASQVINEHFNMNFFELINNFRIQEAIELLKNNVHNNLNIIDIAYEVGFNNKVTFNKSFKKVTSCTPSKYLESQMVPL
ncbi:helix-turn-helix domain-containing protein [Spongiivirga citrea]|uniref:Helix-turn-helix domain-containing protein n=1 Tax=Spongiivirga citrea TaxID=1481457 RepID=A0A6M0CIJ4_9FLAO|nr:helix-turn-helix domain-containing protein [Spongiivirga citrea]NER15759.1 helix-turn-helix domain-containing protein [Spongiivirga citrea]